MTSVAFDLLASSRFCSDYLGIIGYMRNAKRSLEHIRRFRESLRKAESLLREFPGMYQVSTKEELADRGLRECLLDEYRIIFRIDDGKVFLLRLLHQKQRVEDKV